MSHVNVEELLAPVRRYLRGLGIQPQEEGSSPASEAEVSAAEEAIGAPLPSQIRSLYREYANGFRFRWALDDDFDDADERGCLELPDLTALVAYRKPYRDNWASDLDLSVRKRFRPIKAHRPGKTALAAVLGRGERRPVLCGLERRQNRVLHVGDCLTRCSGIGNV